MKYRKRDRETERQRDRETERQRDKIAPNIPNTTLIKPNIMKNSCAKFCGIKQNLQIVANCQA